MNSSRFLSLLRAYKVDPNRTPADMAARLLDTLAGAIPKGSVEVRTPGGASVSVDLGELARQWQALRGTGGTPTSPDSGFPTTASPDCTHCDGPTLLQHFDLPPSTQVTTSGETSAWLQPPANPGGREALAAATRNLLASASLAQDGLKMTTGHPSMDGFFGGGKLVAGATLTLPSAELAALLLSHVVITGSPETVQTLNFAQAALNLLAQVPQAGGQFSKVLSQMLSSGSFPSAERMLKSLAAFLGATGLSGFQEVQDLFKALASEAAKNGPSSEGSEAQFKNQELLQTLALNGLPHMAGIAEAQGAGFFQGLGQIFGSVLRGLAGLMMTNPQNQWPQALPANQLPAELAALLAAQGRKAERERKNKKAAKAASRRRTHGTLEEDEEVQEEAYLEEDKVFRPIKTV